MSWVQILLLLSKWGSAPNPLASKACWAGWPDVSHRRLRRCVPRRSAGNESLLRFLREAAEPLIQNPLEVAIMAKCEVCDKGIQTGHRISITRSQVSRRANKMWRSNIKKVQVVEKNGTIRKAKVCTRCLRSKKVTRAV